MTSPTNLTDRIAQLREKKEASSILNPHQPKATDPNPNSLNEKPFAYDYFTFFAYSLLLTALIGQLFLIVSLDLF